MDTLESLDAMLEDFEETKEKVKASVLPGLQMYHNILCKAEELYLNGILKEEELNSKANTLNDRLQQLFHERNLLTCEQNSLMKSKNDVLEKIQEKEEEFQIQEKKNASRHKAVLLYEEWLCMKIKNIGDSHLVFIFKNTDPVHPDKCCLFQLLVENKIYKVTRCVPELPDADVLLSELNATNDLHKFIVSMRNKFRQIAGCS